jgi:putative nucleotidyltransferase with HDIG domain
MSREEYGRRFVHPDDMWVFQQVAEKRLASTDREFLHDAEHRIVRRDGEVRHVLARIRVSTDATGRVTRYYGANQDITKRKQAAEKLESTLGNLRKAIGGTIQAIVQVVEMRDPYTAGHQRRVADLARSVATEMGLPPDVIEGIRIAAAIHDIGKVAVPAEILSKPGKLTQNELELIKDHSLTGFDILKHVEFPWPIAEIIYQHHERLDGSGYPRGLKGDDVLLEARIIALADVVEAMASHRPFRPARGIDAAMDEIEEHRGTLYDPEVVDTCVKLFREKRYTLNDREEPPTPPPPSPVSMSRTSLP